MKLKKVCAIFVLNDRVNADFLFRTEPSTHIDNEYSRAGIQDPKILITTSRDPSSRLLQFAKVSFFSFASHVAMSFFPFWRNYR